MLDLVSMGDFEYAKVELPLLGEGLHVLKECSPPLLNIGLHFLEMLDVELVFTGKRAKAERQFVEERVEREEIVCGFVMTVPPDRERDEGAGHVVPVDARQTDIVPKSALA